MDSKALSRRLDALQQIADKSKPCTVIVTFKNGSSTTTDPGGAIDILRVRGPSGEIAGFSSDNSTFGPWAQLMTILLRPRANREVSDFE